MRGLIRMYMYIVYGIEYAWGLVNLWRSYFQVKICVVKETLLSPATSDCETKLNCVRKNLGDTIIQIESGKKSILVGKISC